MNDNELFFGCVNGETQAQGLLYEKYNKVLFSICMKYFKNEDESYDCLHDAFMHIFNKLNAMNTNNIVNLEAWMCVVMRNYCLDVLRKKKKEMCFEDIEFFVFDFTNDDSDDEFIPLISHNNLLDLVETLTPQFKKVFIMYAIDEKPHKDIAEELNISVSTSKTNYHRARKMLKKRLGELKLT